MTGAHAARRARFAIGLLLVLLSAAPAFAADASARVALVRAMYQAYAWEAVMARPSHTPLFDQPATVLRGYFDEPLTRLILANQACERRTREICRLDAMPLWDSADPNASDLVVETAADAPEEVRVRFRRFGESGWTEIRFVFATTRDGVRIRDIRYPGGASLLGMLALPGSAGIQPGTATTMPHRIPIDRLLCDLPAELQRLLHAPFPSAVAPPDSTFSWEEWQRWFADAPGRRVHLIADGYRDYENGDDEEPVDDFDQAWNELDAQYRSMAERCVAILEAELGPAHRLGMRDLLSLSMPGWYTPEHPDFERDLPPQLRDPDIVLQSMDRTDIAWWRADGRLVLRTTSVPRATATCISRSRWWCLWTLEATRVHEWTRADARRVPAILR